MMRWWWGGVVIFVVEEAFKATVSSLLGDIKESNEKPMYG
jgi:hypothetical protein